MAYMKTRMRIILQRNRAALTYVRTYARLEITPRVLLNPRRACAARFTVVGYGYRVPVPGLCVYVYTSQGVSIERILTYLRHSPSRKLQQRDALYFSVSFSAPGDIGGVSY